ncbi:uncharacterized protein LOC116415032 isoform X2 [Apis florea]|uniref:uncharacterized protein LOC116415032 isoform X2 n=1 Tax=Apis florea TaxID=7463 RepID=UPI0012FF020F|nr:uncharacterized protein LOC116415032 isoform X2 [Apis florea]
MTSTSDMNRLRVMRSSYGFLAAPAVATRSARTPAATYNPAVGICLPCAYSQHIVSPIASATCPPSSSVSRNCRSNANTFTFLLIRPLRLTYSTIDYFSGMRRTKYCGAGANHGTEVGEFQMSYRRLQSVVLHETVRVISTKALILILAYCWRNATQSVKFKIVHENR